MSEITKFTQLEFASLLQELKNAKEALDWSEAKFRAVFDQAPFSIQIFGLNGKVLLFNKASQKLWGLEDEFVKNFIMKEYCVFDDPVLAEQGMDSAIKKAFSGEVVELEPFKYDPASNGLPGRFRWVEPLLYPLRDQHGNVLEVVLVHNDITETHEAQAERDKLLQELINERNRLEDFISIASHELKTPLTSLNLQMEVIKSIMKSPQDIDREGLLKFSANSLRQLERLSRLVDEMLDISRIAGGKLNLSVRPVELSELTNEVLSRFADQLKELGIELDASELEKVHVKIDPFRMEQVITNLVSNAIRYGARRPIKLILKQLHDKAQLTVCDEGPGIAREDHERIFQRFERIGPSNGISGLGLGLFISRQIVHEMGGKIYVESDLDKGANFYVELPLP